jgi:hypothetical protein
MSADDPNAYNRNYNKRMQEELAEFNTPQARYQQVLDRQWERSATLRKRKPTFTTSGAFRNGGRKLRHSPSRSAIEIGGCASGQVLATAAAVA